MTNLFYLQADHPMNRVADSLKMRIIDAQTNLFSNDYTDAFSLISDVCDQIKINIILPEKLRETDASDFADTNYSNLVKIFYEILSENNVPKHSATLHSQNLSNRIQLIRAFSEPDLIIEQTKNKVIEIVNGFPSKAEHIECGKNKGDVLDAYILAATQYLLYSGNFESAIEATVSHKALMMIEGLLGHLHEDVLGSMRGNVRVPEPRGKNQEEFNYENNPFPGSDLVQPPYEAGDRPKFHQIKSKSGSAKGGDGKRLGDQLRFLEEHYDGEIYYHALIGNTLVGHRSKAGVEKAAPNVVVMVGDASFRCLTRSKVGPQLLLRLYQSSFAQASEETGYNIEEITKVITRTFLQKAEEKGEGFLESILKDVTSGSIAEQDNRFFNKRKKRQ